MNITQFLATAWKNDMAAPRFTFYDSNMRVEFSGHSLLNWAAKTAHFLSDELGMVPGSTVTVQSPVHWQTLSAILGTWWAGGVLCDDGEIVFTTQGEYQQVQAEEIIVLSLDPMGGPARDIEFYAYDYTTSVRTHGDQFPAPQGTVALQNTECGELSHQSVLTSAEVFARDHNLAQATIINDSSWDNVITSLVAPLAYGKSFIQLVNVPPERVANIFVQEKATVHLQL